MSELDNAKLAAWEAEKDDMNVLLQMGAEEFFKKEFPDLKHSFLKEVRMVVCMDEGTAHKDINGESKLCLAGSGILFPAAGEEERIKKVAEMFAELGIDDVTSHGGCGAAGLAYKRDFPDSDPKIVKPEAIEKYAMEWSQKVAEEMERMNRATGHTHILAEDMERPVEFHVARVVYFDGIGGFNPNKEIGLPMGFVISRKFVPKTYAAEELKVAVNIAFGHHGFGELFSQESPFIVVVFARTGDELEDLKKEVAEALAGDGNLETGKIKIDGLKIE